MLVVKCMQCWLVVGGGVVQCWLVVGGKVQCWLVV